MLSCRDHPRRRPWPLHDLPVSRRHVNSVVTTLTEQNELVSSPLYYLFHLFPSHADSDTEIALWPRKLIRLLRHCNRDCETKDRIRRTPQAPSLVSILLRETAASSTWPQTVPNTVKFRPLPLEKMHLHASLCALLLGFAITSSADLIHQSATLVSLSGLLSVAAADRFTHRNGYGIVEAGYHLTAYDCSDPSEVQAYSSIPASHCSTRATPVRKD